MDPLFFALICFVFGGLGGFVIGRRKGAAIRRVRVDGLKLPH